MAEGGPEIGSGTITYGEREGHELEGQGEGWGGQQKLTCKTEAQGQSRKRCTVAPVWFSVAGIAEVAAGKVSGGGSV